MKQETITNQPHYYLGCYVTYEYKNDIFTRIGRAKNRILKNDVQREIVLISVKQSHVSSLVLGSETWVTSKKVESRLPVQEM